MTKLEVTGYEGSPTPRRRCLAYALDSVPRWSAVLAGTAPVLMLLAALSFQDLLGVGIFDPSAGGDPILIGATVVVSGRALRWLLILGAWTAIQCLLVVLMGASLGKLVMKLRVSRVGQQGTSRARLMARELARDAPGALLIATSAAYAYVRTPMTLFAVLLLECACASLAMIRSGRAILRDGGARSWLDVATGTRVVELNLPGHDELIHER